MTQDKVQKAAVEAWIKCGKKGTLELSTGTGKTIAALLCLMTMPKNDKIHLFLAETKGREKDLNDDIEKFNSLFNVDIRKDYTIVFKCYQGVYNLEGYDFGLVIADEFHNSLSPQYSKFYDNNTYDAIVALSATISEDTTYVNEDGTTITKGEMLSRIAPVCYQYTLAQSLKDGLGRVVDVHVIKMQLDAVTANVPTGSGSKRFYQTEVDKYTYLNKNFLKSFYTGNAHNREVLIQSAYRRRAEFLYTLPLRISEAQKVVSAIEGKSVIFSNSLDALLKVTPDVISSKNEDSVNKSIRERFDNNDIQLIGSNKMLKQGSNLRNLDNCIMMSYGQSKTDTIQITGRLRKNGDKVGNIVIFVAVDTSEEQVLEKVLVQIPYRRCIYYQNANEYLNTLNEAKELTEN